MRKFMLLVGMSSLLLVAGVAHGGPVFIPAGVADPLSGMGMGLCEASASSKNPGVDFAVSKDAFVSTINAYIDVHKADRIERTRQSPIDLFSAQGQGQSGDFTICNGTSCDALFDPKNGFASRFRGYLNVTPDLANQPLHFGFYVDDAVALVIYDGNLNAYPVVVREPQIGIPAWRITAEVHFLAPGLYPIEVDYAQIGVPAVLEMSYFIGTFNDYERGASTPPIVPLDSVGFNIFSAAAFFQTLDGNPPFPPSLSTCMQCDRAQVNTPQADDCLKGYYCNSAALCAPCTTSLFCGESCSPCGIDTPYCESIDGSYQCVGCRKDTDCMKGATCDPTTHVCNGSSSSSSGGNGGRGGNGGEGGNGGNGGGNHVEFEGSCECGAVANNSSTGISAMVVLGFVGLGVVRRRKRATQRAAENGGRE